MELLQLVTDCWSTSGTTSSRHLLSPVAAAHFVHAFAAKTDGIPRRQVVGSSIKRNSSCATARLCSCACRKTISQGFIHLVL